MKKEFATVTLKILSETLKQSGIWRTVQLFICNKATYLQILCGILHSSNLVPFSIH